MTQKRTELAIDDNAGMQGAFTRTIATIGGSVSAAVSPAGSPALHSVASNVLYQPASQVAHCP